MGKVRVLVVDDSVVIRRMLTEILSGDPSVEVVGTASNGRIAVQKITQIQPDVVVMDVEMPEMNGLEALAEMRKTHARLPIIMFSTLTTRGGTATLDALALGATDYVAKPANMGSVQASIDRIREELLPKVKVLGGAPNVVAATAPAAAPSAPAPVRRPRPPGPTRVDIVAIGVSTGGPKALGEIIPRLPGDLPVPIVIVQHMPPIFTGLLAERLDATSALEVREAHEADRVTAGRVLIAPGDFHLRVVQRGDGVHAQLDQGPPENSCRPAVDVLFRSVAEVYGSSALAVVLTGMGQDGLRGAEVLVEAGGRVVAQDERTSVVWGMPGFVARAGLAEDLVPLDVVASEIVRRVQSSSRLPSAGGVR
ncbi:MAG: chemotaxis response regulator protein-glutamate methylesterase [Acidimicrobiia bacterium]|nr:chemotaxis response regulator protein-glutamate methylesterase [Acidimicrobiia bacterium]